MLTPSEALSRYFGYSEFRLNQESIIQSVLSGNDSFAIMPTGGGKSLCYQIPSLLQPGIGLVISPLIALMKDQVDALKASGIAAASLNSTQSPEEQEWIYRQLKIGEMKILYLSPERLLGGPSSYWLDRLKELPVSLIAVDEAHCISQWGPDFRPDYLHLGQLKEHFPRTPVLALTASADPQTRKDIIHQLRLQSPKIFLSSFDRPNITYRVWPKQKGIHQVLDFVKGHRGQSGIVYCLSRKSTEKLADTLRHQGLPAAAYHAALDAGERGRIQEAFQKDEVRIIVATIAFGMGIDKSNVRYVIHYDTPRNMEGYYQETGRAGRDGLASEALLLYSYGDILKLENFILSEEAERAAVQRQKLFQMKAYAETPGCRRKKILASFGEEYEAPCHRCDFCLQGLRPRDGTQDAQRILSAVARTGEYYGSGFIIDFLRGSRSRKISQTLRSTKTWGAGKHHPAATWKYLIDQLVEGRYLDLQRNPYPILRLNKKSWEVLKNNQRVSLFYPEEEKAIIQEQWPAEAEERFQWLVEARARIAQKIQVPAYSLVSDLSLREMALKPPATLQDILAVPGIGEYKARQFGPAFLEALRQAPAPRASGSARPARSAAPSPRAKGSSQEATYQLLEEGFAPEDIAGLRRLSLSTIQQHLLDLLDQGRIKLSQYLDSERIRLIEARIRETGQFHKSKPIVDSLAEEVSYWEVRMVQTAMRKEQEEKSTGSDFFSK